MEEDNKAQRVRDDSEIWNWVKIQQELKKKELVWCREKLVGLVWEWDKLEMMAEHFI